MSNVSTFIKELGGAAEVSRKTGVYTPDAVRQWAFKKKIPRSAWPDLKRAYPRKVTDKKLLEIEASARLQTAA